MDGKEDAGLKTWALEFTLFAYKSLAVGFNNTDSSRHLTCTFDSRFSQLGTSFVGSRVAHSDLILMMMVTTMMMMMMMMMMSTVLVVVSWAGTLRCLRPR